MCVVVDIDHMIMIVVTKRQKDKKDKKTKIQKDNVNDSMNTEHLYCLKHE